MPTPDVDAPQPTTPSDDPQGGTPPRGLMGQWNDWLAKPQNRAQMIQMGIDLLQPPGPGQSAIGQIGQAIGGGFEARDTQLAQTQELAKQQLESQRLAEQTQSESELRAAQAEEAQARAKYYTTGGSRAYGAESRRAANLRAEAETWLKDATAAETELLTADEADKPALIARARHAHEAETALLEEAARAPTYTGPVTGRPPGKTDEELIALARQALHEGRPIQQVKNGLEKMGINSSVLDTEE